MNVEKMVCFDGIVYVGDSVVEFSKIDDVYFF